jgi:hypothetical protein
MGRLTKLVEESNELNENRLTTTSSRYFRFSEKFSFILQDVKQAHDDLDKLDGYLHNLIQDKSDLSDEDLDKEVIKFIKEFFQKNKNSVLKEIHPQVVALQKKYFK